MFFLQMSGFPGSGKSTLANEVSHRLHNTVIVDHDIVKTALLEAIPKENAINIGKVSYQLEWNLIENYISQGLSSQIPDTSEEYYQATLKNTQYPSSNYLVVNSDSPVESYIDDVIEYLKK